MSHQLIFDKTKELVNSFKDLVFNSSLRDKYYPAILSIINVLNDPCRLVITGRVKSGKSSLINVLLGKDYAVVGTSETTATINIFKYGRPKSKETPILCEYVDGTSKWVSDAYLKDLQGVSDEVLSEICLIKNLTYFIEDERLKDIVLIDTPGIDAVVGNDGDAHQLQTESFLGLRERHSDETISISNNADAVVLLLGDVAHESDIDFINAFLANRGDYSCLNTIGIMSQIDLTDERIDKRHEMAKDRYNRLSAYVNSVIPISAGLKRFLPSIEDATKIKECISKISSKEKLDKLLLRSAKLYFMSKIPGIEIDLEERKRIYPKGMPFRCFAVTAKILYDYSVEKALKIIDEMSGIELLKETLDVQFFSRSKEIKAEIAIKNVLMLIWDILNCQIHQTDKKTDKESSIENIEQLSKRFYDIQISLEKLSQITFDTNKYFQCLIFLLENKSLFSIDEFNELNMLFSGKTTEFDQDRLNYWFREKNNTANEVRLTIASNAYSKYTDLAFRV